MIDDGTDDPLNSYFEWRNEIPVNKVIRILVTLGYNTNRNNVERFIRANRSVMLPTVISDRYTHQLLSLNTMEGRAEFNREIETKLTSLYRHFRIRLAVPEGLTR